MKGDRNNTFISVIANIVVFILLETAALLLVSEHSIVQRSKLMTRLGFVTASFTGAIDGIGGYFGLRKENAILAAENAALRANNDRLRAMVSESVIPDSISGASDLFEYIPAKVVSNSSDSRHNLMIIDKGSADGIKKDMGVITDKGIIGYVLTAGEHYSKVSSMMDTDNMASAILKKDNTFGILQWDGTRMNELTLHDIPVHTQFTNGDTVVSSGYSLIYPAGIPIGTVTGKELRDGVNYSLTVATFEKYSRLRYVYVVSRKDIEELNELTQEAGDEE